MFSTHTPIDKIANIWLLGYLAIGLFDCVQKYILSTKTLLASISNMFDWHSCETNINQAHYATILQYPASPEKMLSWEQNNKSERIPKLGPNRPLHYWLRRSMEFEKYKKWAKVDTCFSLIKPTKQEILHFVRPLWPIFCNQKKSHRMLKKVWRGPHPRLIFGIICFLKQDEIIFGTKSGS